MSTEGNEFWVGRRLLPLWMVMEWIGASRSTVYKWIADMGFPRPVRAGARASRWREEEIQAWIDNLPRAAEENRR